MSMSVKQCPVCEKNLPDPLPPFCEQCGWEVLLFLEEIPEDIEKEYHQRLEIVKRKLSFS